MFIEQLRKPGPGDPYHVKIMEVYFLGGPRYARWSYRIFGVDGDTGKARVVEGPKGRRVEVYGPRGRTYATKIDAELAAKLHLERITQ